MAIFDIDGCEEKIGYVFKNKMLLRQCFTHASYANEHGGNDNELLEFFGDTVIQFVVTEYLYKNSLGDEGKLTKLRADMVSKQPLLNVVKKLGISKFLLLGNGQGKSVNQDEKLYSSVYEALVAGIYIDGGMVAAKKFVTETLIKDFTEKLSKKPKETVKSQNKSQLQEYVQKGKMGSISYETLSKKGPDHAPEFRCAVLLNGMRIAEGKGKSIRAAEAVAAESALKRLKKQGGRKS